MRINEGIIKLATANALFWEHPLALNAKPTKKVIMKAKIVFINVLYNDWYNRRPENLGKRQGNTALGDSAYGWQSG